MENNNIKIGTKLRCKFVGSDEKDYMTIGKIYIVHSLYSDGYSKGIIIMHDEREEFRFTYEELNKYFDIVDTQHKIEEYGISKFLNSIKK